MPLIVERIRYETFYIYISWNTYHKYKTHNVQTITGPVARQVLLKLLSLYPLKIKSANHLKIEDQRRLSRLVPSSLVPTKFQSQKIEFWNILFLSFLCISFMSELRCSLYFPKCKLFSDWTRKQAFTNGLMINNTFWCDVKATSISGINTKTLRLMSVCDLILTSFCYDKDAYYLFHQVHIHCTRVLLEC